MAKAGVAMQANGPAQIYKVMLDQHGVAYLRVGYTTRGVLLILNNGQRVDLVEMENSTAHSRDLRPVEDASILENAKVLAKPLNSGVQVSDRALQELQKILSNEELKTMAQVAVARKAAPAAAAPAAAAPAKPKLVKGAKTAAAPAKAAKAPKAAAAPAAEGTARMRYAGKKIKVLNKQHGAREGTKRANAMELLFKCKNTDEALPKLEKIGADPSFIRFAIEKGLIALV